MSKRYI